MYDLAAGRIPKGVYMFLKEYKYLWIRKTNKRVCTAITLCGVYSKHEEKRKYRAHAIFRFTIKCLPVQVFGSHIAFLFSHDWNPMLRWSTARPVWCAKMNKRLLSTRAPVSFSFFFRCWTSFRLSGNQQQNHKHRLELFFCHRV